MLGKELNGWKLRCERMIWLYYMLKDTLNYSSSALPLLPMGAFIWLLFNQVGDAFYSINAVRWHLVLDDFTKHLSSRCNSVGPSNVHPTFSNPPRPTRRKHYASHVLCKLNNVFFTFSPTSLFDLTRCLLSEKNACACCSTKVVMMYLLSFVNLIATIAGSHIEWFFLHFLLPLCTGSDCISSLDLRNPSLEQ
jgi:hypothetical protein